MKTVSRSCLRLLLMRRDHLQQKVMKMEMPQIFGQLTPYRVWLVVSFSTKWSDIFSFLLPILCHDGSKAAGCGVHRIRTTPTNMEVADLGPMVSKAYPTQHIKWSLNPKAWPCLLGDWMTRSENFTKISEFFSFFRVFQVCTSQLVVVFFCTNCCTWRFCWRKNWRKNGKQRPGELLGGHHNRCRQWFGQGGRFLWAGVFSQLSNG